MRIGTEQKTPLGSRVDSDGSSEAWGAATLLAFWFPLALSWAMMALAQPMISAGISRLPDAPVHLAAFGFAQDLAVLIESPIIMLLSASVALVRDEQSYRVLRGFMLQFGGWLTLLFAVTAFTPLYDLVARDIVGIPSNLVDASRPAMALLLPWVPAIAWRRFYQGLLISGGYPRLLTYGTGCRVAALALVVWAGVRWPFLPGTSLGALALSVSVVVEAVVVTLWALPLVRRLPVGNRENLTFRRVLGFYAPLAVTDIMRVLSRPMTTAGIARAAAPLVSLAAWPVASGFVQLVSSGVMAFQEMVVFVSSSSVGTRRVSRFVLWVGSVIAAVVGLSAFTPALAVYLRHVIGVPSEIAMPAVASVRILALFPVLLAVRNLLRGILIAHRRTIAVQHAMTANFLSLACLLGVGMAIGMPGIILASAATVLSQVVEDLFLFVAYQIIRPHVLGLGQLEEKAIPS